MKKEYKNVVQRLRERIKPENKNFVLKNLSIISQINHLLASRGWSQKDFAENIQKEPSEISKWLSGMHNLTLQSITKMETILGEDIIVTPLEARDKYNKIEYVVLKVYAKSNEENLNNEEYSEQIILENKTSYPKVA